MTDAELDGQGSVIPLGVMTGQEVVPDGDTISLLHLNRESAFGETDSFAYDFSGHGNSATITGAEYRSDGGYPNHGMYLHFDDQYEYAVLSDLNSSVDRSKGLTLSARVRFPTFSDEFIDRAYIWDFRGTGSSRRLKLNSTTGLLRLCLNSGHCRNYSGMTEGNWHHVVVTIDGYDWSVYVDGDYKGQTSDGVSLYDFGDSFDLSWGGANSGGKTLADLDELAVWNTVLTPQQIQDLSDGRVVTGEFESAVIETANPAYYVNASWQQDGFEVVTQVSGDLGTTWCDIGNGHQVHYFSCGLPSAQLKYRVRFNGAASLDQMTLSWSEQPAACPDQDEDGFDDWDGVYPHCVDDGLPRDCSDTNPHRFPTNPNLFCNCVDDDGYPRPDLESYYAGVCGDGLDNDCDGLVDGLDPDCYEDPSSWEPLDLKFTGIELLVKGSKFNDYAIERLWHDRKSDDDIVLYLKSESTQLDFAHNEDNLAGGGLRADSVYLMNRNWEDGQRGGVTLQVRLKPSVVEAKNFEPRFEISVVRDPDTDQCVQVGSKWEVDFGTNPYFSILIDDLDTPGIEEELTGLTLDNVENVASSFVDIFYLGGSARAPIDIPRTVPRLAQEGPDGAPGWCDLPAQRVQVIDPGDIYYRINSEIRDPDRYDYVSNVTDGGGGGEPVRVTDRMLQMLQDPELGYFRHQGPFSLERNGLVDQYGDHWLTLAFWDNDWATNWNVADRRDDGGSDAKIVQVVVNPETPAISFDAEPGAEFYTTPPKTYFTAHIHEQITYLTAGVRVYLFNVTNSDPIYYRVNQGSWAQYQGSMMSETLFGSAGTVYDLQFRIGTQGVVKTRKVHYEPAQPAQSEEHPKLVFDGVQELQEERLAVHGGNPEKTDHHDALLRDLDSVAFDFRMGLRNLGYSDNKSYFYVLKTIGGEAYKYALGGILEENEDYLEIAKNALLFMYTMDPVGCENSKGRSGGPSQERCMYSDGRVNPSVSRAYDLIHLFTQEGGYSKGMTPIEHIKIRDNLANEASILLKYPHTHPEDFWSSERFSHNGVRNFELETTYTGIAMAMPSYDSHYYGTSGADKTTLPTHYHAPFPDALVSWSQLNFTGFVQHPTNPDLFRDSFLYGLFESDGSYVGTTREGYVNIMYLDVYPFMEMRENFDGVHYSRLEENIRQEILSSRTPYSGEKLRDTYGSNLGRDDYGGVTRFAGTASTNITYILNQNFQYAPLYLWAYREAQRLYGEQTEGRTFGNTDYLIDPDLEPEAPTVTSRAGNNYISFSQDLTDPEGPFMRMKVLASQVPHESGSALKYYAGNFKIFAHGEPLVFDHTDGYGSIPWDELQRSHRQNIIMIDEADPAGYQQVRGSIQGAYFSPEFDYGRMETDLSITHSASPFKEKDVNQVRHMFFPDKKFFVLADLLQSGTGSHDYDFVLHGSKGANEAANAFEKDLAEDYAVWRRSSGVKLYTQFVSDVELNAEDLELFDYGYGNYEPYIKARQTGTDVEYLVLLFPLAAADGLPWVARTNTLQFDAAEFTVDGEDFLVLLNRSGAPVNFAGLSTDAEIALIKLAAGGSVEYCAMIGGSSLSYSGSGYTCQME